MHITPAVSNNHHEPFHQELDPDLFFPGARREETCQTLILDLLTGKQFLHLSGDAGSGKSLVCRVIMERLPSSFTPVYMESPTGSYEDLLRHACLDLGAPRAGKPDNFSWPEEFNRQLLQRRDTNGRVVLIIDQAEQLFSATLERLLHRNFLADDEEPAFSILLAGSSGLNPLLAQLAALSPQNTPGGSYTLPPLDLDDTEKYLAYRLHAAGIDWDEHDQLLDKKLVSRVYKKAQGNIALTNTAAAELLAKRLPRSLPVETVLPEEPLFHDPAQDERPAPHAPNTVIDASDAPVQTLEEQYAPFLIDLYELLTQNKKLLGSLLATAFFLLGLGLFLESKPAPISQDLRQQQAEVNTAVQTQPNNSERLQAAAQSVEQQAREAAGDAGASAQPDSERLLRERQAASTALVAASYRGASTVQLLTVSGSDAEERLKQLLSTQPLVRESEQLYIIKKRSDSPVYFVFYGIFDTLEQARQVRNSMSFELRTHHPYPLSITDALLLNEG
ncbi:MAG: AAA family ATPase [Desulfobulbaceae bacterium]|nr:AAA family ATPase [Desulfobulbaceae bacterium]